MKDNKSSIINSSDGDERTILSEIPVISVITEGMLIPGLTSSTYRSAISPSINFIAATSMILSF